MLSRSESLRIRRASRDVQPLDLSKLRVLPLAERKSLTRADEILVDPDAAPPPCPDPAIAMVDGAAESIRAARAGAAVVLIYGAHLLRNGAARSSSG